MKNLYDKLHPAFQALIAVMVILFSLPPIWWLLLKWIQLFFGNVK